MQPVLLDLSQFETERLKTEEFISELKKKKRPLYALGRNLYSKALIDLLGIQGVIDEFTSETSWHGTPVLSLDRVPKDSLVIVCAGGKTQTALAAVRTAGIEAIDYFAFWKHSGRQDLPQIVFNENFEEEFRENEPQYVAILNRLQDPESRNTFRRLVTFRLHPYLKILEGFQDRQTLQYFEDFLGLDPSGEVFLDVGCFDGMTSIEFAKRCPNYKKIVAFEPEPGNFERCLKNLSHMQNVEVMPFGLASEPSSLRFVKDGSASSISHVGSCEIQVRRLDDVLPQERVTFIKVDIEGAEMSAILGAEKTIKKWKPKLAISVYHKPGDFWHIPSKVLELNPTYKVYIRHYTETIYETVMFFVP